MPPEYVPLITLIIGLIFQPVKDGIVGWNSGRRAESQRRWQFQFDTLTDLAAAMEEWRASGSIAGSGAKAIHAKERARVLTPRIHDDRLRELMEPLFGPHDDAWAAKYDVALQRLGEVLREM